MTFISTAELTELRADQATAMPFTCTVSVPGTPVDTDYGGTTPGTPSTATVACRVGSPSGSDLETANRIGSSVDAVVTMPYGTVVGITATISAAETGRTYGVVSINDEQAYQVGTRCLCRRIS